MKSYTIHSSIGYSNNDVFIEIPNNNEIKVDNYFMKKIRNIFRQSNKIEIDDEIEGEELV